WVRLELSPSSGAVAIREIIPLTRLNGKPLTGLPNLAATRPGMAFTDETPIDLRGQTLQLDPMGLDLEGIVRAEDGTYWMGDEYRPSICHFDSQGRLLARYVPKGSNRFGVETGIEALPAELALRRDNRGFEGIAVQDGKVYAFVQSPLDNP